MKFAPITIASAVSMGASINTNGVELSPFFCGSIQAVWTGSSPTGTFKLQISNDNVVVDPGSTNPSSNVVNWSDWTGSSLPITTTGDFVWKLGSCLDIKWIRLVYTRVSGTGTLNATLMGKG